MRLVVLSVGLSCLAGCTGVGEYFHNGFKVGREYMRPAALVADDWRDSGDSRLESGAAEGLRWWAVFQDPTLDHLIAIACQQNITLREAGLRIVEAQEQRAVVAGTLFPQVQDAVGEFAHSQRSTKTATFRRSSSQIDSGNVGLREFSNWRLGGSLAWELDFWGRFRRAIEAADARLDSSIENYDDALVLLIAEVATAYVDYRTVQQRLTFARSNADLQRESTRIAEVRKSEDARDSEIDAPQAKSNLARTLAGMEALEIALRRHENWLAVLLGMPPHDLAYLLDGPQPVPVAPETVAIGVPAELLRRRPDVRRAERLVAAANADIGVAEANLYPRVMLNGATAYEAAQFGDLFDAGAWSGSVGPSFRWNILNYGRLLHSVQVQDARFQQQVAAFEQTVLTANEEAENAITAFLHYHVQIKLLAQSVADAQEAVRVAQAKYFEGQIDFNRVFTVQQLLTTQQDQLATSQGNLALSLIELYRALGGGWEIRLEPVSVE